MAAVWEAGMDGAVIPHITPSECRGMFAAQAACATRCAADIDTQAWLTGSYAGVAVNAPKKFPRKPRSVERIARKNALQKPAMTDDEMLTFMREFAQKGASDGQRNGAGNTGNSV